MKRFFVFLGLLSFSASLLAAPPIYEMPLKACTDAFSVSINTYSWTQVPTANCANRIVVTLVNKSGNTGDFVGIVTNNSNIPTISTNTFSIYIPKGTTDRGYPITAGAYLWLKTTNTSAETVTGQEFSLGDQ